MSDKKISELTALTAPDGTEELVVNDSGTSKKITQTNLLSTALPLAGGTMTGTIAGFTSTGIDDNATSTAITIDASENISFGTASILPDADNVEGVAIATGSYDGRVGISRDGLGLIINRKTSDGDIVAFKKDGTTVGSIGTSFGDFTIGGKSGLRFDSDTSQYVIPYNVTDNTHTTTVDLGTSDRNFKDLYLSGSVYLGGTAAANALDDYEEGDWDSEVGGTATYGVNQARYTKIGRQVIATFDLNITTIGTGSTTVVTGLPFAVGDSIAEGVSVSFFDGLATSVVFLTAYAINSEIRFRALTAAGTGLTDASVLGSGCRVTGTVSYTV